jgi:hypothetical protein
MQQANCRFEPVKVSILKGRNQAATLARNPSTSRRSSPAAASTACEADNTLSADWRVSVAAPATS